MGTPFPVIADGKDIDKSGTTVIVEVKGYDERRCELPINDTVTTTVDRLESVVKGKRRVRDFRTWVLPTCDELFGIEDLKRCHPPGTALSLHMTGNARHLSGISRHGFARRDLLSIDRVDNDGPRRLVKRYGRVSE